MGKQEEVSLWLKFKDGVTASFESAKNSINKNFKQIQEASLVFIGAFAGVTAGVLSFLKTSGQFEQWNIAFTTMLGSSKKAADLLEEIKVFAKETPFELPGIVESSKQLLAFGVEQKNIIPTMRNLGDIAAGLGVPIGQLTYVFGQVKVAGRMMSQDLNQFTNAGVPMIEALSKTMGVAQTDIKKMIETGKVGFPEVQKAIEYLSGEGGKFNGLMAAQSKSLLGVWSNFKDGLTQVGLTIGNILLPPALKIAVFMSELTGKIVDIIPKIKDFIIPIGVLAAGISGLMAAAVGFVTVGPMIGAAFTAMTGPIGIAVVAISSIAAAVVYFKTSGSDLAISVRAAWSSIGKAITEYAHASWEAIKNLGDIFGNFGEMMNAVISGRFKEAKNAFAEMGKAAQNIGNDFVEASEAVKTTFEENVEAERAAFEASREAKLEDNELRLEMDVENNEAKLGLDQEFLDQKAALEQIAESARVEFENQKKQFDAMTSAEKLKVLQDTLGKEKILKETAAIDELVNKGKHEEAKKKMNELYGEAFREYNSKLLKDLDAEWRKHWDAQIAMSIFGKNMTKTQYEAMGDFFKNVMTLMGKESVAAFRIMQGVAIVNTLVATYEMATKAFNAMVGIPYVGPILGGIAAGAAVAVGLSNVDQIRRQEPPQAETGAYVEKGGLAELHDQEMVLNKEQTAALAASGGTQHIYLQLDRETLQHWIIASDAEAARMEKLGAR